MCATARSSHRIRLGAPKVCQSRYRFCTGVIFSSLDPLTLWRLISKLGGEVVCAAICLTWSVGGSYWRSVICLSHTLARKAEHECGILNLDGVHLRRRFYVQAAFFRRTLNSCWSFLIHLTASS